MNTQKLKLFCGRYHYATILLKDVKRILQNGSYWFIEMKDGDYWEDCDMFVIV